MEMKRLKKAIERVRVICRDRDRHAYAMGWKNRYTYRWRGKDR
jgi:hypothetical protein